MNIMFATRNVGEAVLFLRKMTGCKDLTDKSIPKLSYLISEDIVRVSDPDFHSGMLIEGKNYVDEYSGRIDEAVKELRDIVGKDNIKKV